MSTKRIVIVTGGSQNIGLAIAERFLHKDTHVISADLNAPQNSALGFVKTDVSDEASVVALMLQVEEQFGHLDVLINNAGICIETSIQETSLAQWDTVMGVNIKGTFLTTKHAFKLMTNKGATSPAIVNISSIEGLGANPLHSVYAASKAAVAGFTHNTSLEYGPHGIRCNAVAPGWINTPFNEQFLAQFSDRSAVDAQVESLHPVGRLGIPQDVANTVFWLASQESGFVTGQEIIVDGGRLAKLPLPKL